MTLDRIIEMFLELARKKLISDLKKKGIIFLLKNMASDKYVSPLVKIKRFRGSFSSKDDVSTYAFQLSSYLNSVKDKNKLMELLEDPKCLSLQFYIYCCLSSICSNTNDIELYNFLINKIEYDLDERTKIAILVRLKEMKKNRNVNIAPIKKILLEGTIEQKNAAIKALSNTSDKDVEELLLNEFKLGDRDIKSSICITLKSIGTKKSIPVLINAHKKTRDFGLRTLINNVIEIIESKENSYH